MATRCYITSRPLNTILRGPLQGNWSAGDSTRDVRGFGHWTLLLADTAANGGVNANGTEQLFGNSITKTNNQPIPSYRWATKPLSSGGTFTGTLTVTFKVRKLSSSASNTVFGQIYAYITVGDSLTVRAVVANNLVSATAWTTTSTWRELTFTLAAESWQAGDRIIVEFGGVCTPGSVPGDDNAYRIAYGTVNSSNVVLADATNGSTAARAGWMEFSDTLSFVADPSPPINDACADAIVVGALPYIDGPRDVSMSTDTDRAVWYSWTCPTTGRYTVNIWESNYAAQIRVFTDGCGTLTPVLNTEGSAFRQKVGWLGYGQAAATWDATGGRELSHPANGDARHRRR